MLCVCVFVSQHLPWEVWLRVATKSSLSIHLDLTSLEKFEVSNLGLGITLNYR